MAQLPEKQPEFAADYVAARARFRAAAAKRGARLQCFSHPSCCDRYGGPLTIDVASLGDSQTSTALLMLSGTHGVEGPPGSAIQTAWLEQNDGNALPPGLKVVVLHALNPWGFAYCSRTTENNVDLNRNFIDFDMPLPVNAGYAAVHDIVCPGGKDSVTVASVHAALQAFEAQHGYQALSDALGAGQYQYPTGLSYGGAAPEWSNTVLHEVLRTELAGVERLGVIDWHTGRGDFGKPFYLCFSGVDSEMFNVAANWWGRDNLTAKDSIGEAYEGVEPPQRHGLLFRGIERAMGAASVAGAVIEIGTYEPERVMAAEIVDRWLKFAADPSDPRLQRYRESVLEAFVPASESWRAQLSDTAMPVIEAAVAGLAEWHQDEGC